MYAQVLAIAVLLPVVVIATPVSFQVDEDGFTFDLSAPTQPKIRVDRLIGVPSARPKTVITWHIRAIKNNTTIFDSAVVPWILLPMEEEQVPAKYLNDDPEAATTTVHKYRLHSDPIGITNTSQTRQLEILFKIPQGDLSTNAYDDAVPRGIRLFNNMVFVSVSLVNASWPLEEQANATICIDWIFSAESAQQQPQAFFFHAWPPFSSNPITRSISLYESRQIDIEEGLQISTHTSGVYTTQNQTDDDLEQRAFKGVYEYAPNNETVLDRTEIAVGDVVVVTAKFNAQLRPDLPKCDDCLYTWQRHSANIQRNGNAMDRNNESTVIIIIYFILFSGIIFGIINNIIQSYQ